MSQSNASEYFQKCADYASYRCMERNKDFHRCMEEDKDIFIQDYNSCRTIPLEVPLLSDEQKKNVMDEYLKYSHDRRLQPKQE